MIKQGPELQAWIDYQLTNPPKTTKKLESPDGSRCCLGNLCHLLIPEERKQEFYPARDEFEVRYGCATSALPKELQIRLNLDSPGNFTEKGTRYVRIFLRENNIIYTMWHPSRESPEQYIACLASVNDNTTADHYMIGLLIQHLADIERIHGIECFSQYNLGA